MSAIFWTNPPLGLVKVYSSAQLPFSLPLSPVPQEASVRTRSWPLNATLERKQEEKQKGTPVYLGQI